ncbi:hypothetical protein HZH68_002767 [Vespula germanica]|uniref:Uncharacterized protein n=1 Tax=Vespula germanica TaxID=30212 RepID=A0A834NMY7_VESGE|nr:hypothetical protein HZH68_002767 [Vespula germanica]
MSIAALLQAAEYIERREREAEHGYASTMPIPDDMRTVTKRPKTKKSQGSRTTHNELEKNSGKSVPLMPAMTTSLLHNNNAPTAAVAATAAATAATAAATTASSGDVERELGVVGGCC